MYFDSISKIISPEVGNYEEKNDLFITPLLNKKFCSHLIEKSEEQQFENKSGNYDLFLSKIENGGAYCKLWKEIINCYIDKKVEDFYTSAIKGRLWKNYPVPFIKKFSEEGQRNLKLHNDNSLLTFFVKLNEDYKGCDTVYPRQDWDNSKMKVGDCCVAPGTVTHPHYTTELISGKKYSLIGRHTILNPREDDFDEIKY